MDPRTHNQPQFALLGLLLGLTFAPSSFAKDNLQQKLADREEKMRSAFINHFVRVTSNKNVMTRAIDPEGKVQNVPGKENFNADDDQNFKSDFTNHNRTKDWVEDVPRDKDGKPLDPNAVPKTYRAGLSPHGKISSGGGSSETERKPTELNEKFRKQDEDKRKADIAAGRVEPSKNLDPEYDGLFVTEKQEAEAEVDDNSAPSSPGSPKKKQKVKVSRRSIRQEAIQEIRDIGVNGSQTAIAVTKDKDKENDPNAAANGVFLRFEAQAYLDSLRKTSIKNLGQRRMNKRLRKGGSNSQIETEVPTCVAYLSAELAKEMKNSPNMSDQAKKQLQEEYAKEQQRCEKVASTDYAMVSPEFETDDQGKETGNLKEGKLENEDDMERDLRAQVELLDNSNKTLKDVKSIWKYSDKDNRARAVFKTEGNNVEERDMTVKEQIELYNDQLREADESIKRIQKRSPGFKPAGNPLDYLVTENQPLQNITKPPDSAWEEYGYKNGPPQLKKPVRNYTELIQQNQQSKQGL